MFSEIRLICAGFSPVGKLETDGKCVRVGPSDLRVLDISALPVIRAFQRETCFG